jgi:hypothetical protein
VETKKFLALPLLALVLLGGGCAREEESEVAVSNDVFLSCQEAGGTISNSYPRQCTNGSVRAEEEDGGNMEAKANFIQLDVNPLAPVKDTITLKGQARGGWYSEAQFPVVVFAANGGEIGRGVAKAKGEWMTEEFVPFEVTVKFTQQQPYTLGRVMLQKDNPSGLVENDDALIVPITFGK